MSETVAARVVYIVETDRSVRESLARVVDSAGLESMQCELLEEFLRQMPAAHAACVVLDIAALSERRGAVPSSLSATAATIPVIALSAHDDLATRRLARELGAAAFFRKPVDAAALLDSIAWVMRAEAAHPSS